MRSIGLCLLLALLPAHAADSGADARPRGFAEAVALAQAALAREDWAAAHAALLAADATSRGHPSVLHHLARVQGLRGQPAAAVATLERLVAANGSRRDLRDDPAFAAVEPQTLAALEQRLHEAAAPVVHGEVAFELPEPDFIPEGIAHDPSSGDFFVGSLHGGDIVRIGPDGRVSTFVRDAPGVSRGQRGQVIGLRVQPGGGRLWAATVALDPSAPAYARGPGGRSRLQVFDLASGERIASYAAPDDALPHLLNDLDFAPNGDLYVTDSEAHALYRLRAGADALELVYRNVHALGYPNGVAVDAARNAVHVASLEGIWSFQLDDPSAAPRLLPLAAGSAAAIDGLYRCGAGLIGIHPILDGAQVSHFALDPAGTTIAAVEPLERGHPAHDIPTTGVIVGDAFYYVAGSQLGRLARDGSIQTPAAPGRRSAIVRLPLHGRCG